MGNFDQNQPPLKKLQELLNLTQKPGTLPAFISPMPQPPQEMSVTQKYYRHYRYQRKNHSSVRNALHYIISRYLKHCNEALELQVSDTMVNEMTMNLAAMTRAYKLIKENKFENLKVFDNEGIALNALISFESQVTGFIVQEASLAFKNQDYVRAQNLFHLLVILEPNKHVFSLSLGIVEQKSGNYQEAIRAYNLTISNAPKSVEAMFCKAQCYLRLGKKTLAEYTAQRALTITKDIEYFENLQKDIIVFLQHFTGE